MEFDAFVPPTDHQNSNSHLKSILISTNHNIFFLTDHLVLASGRRGCDRDLKNMHQIQKSCSKTNKFTWLLINFQFDNSSRIEWRVKWFLPNFDFDGQWMLLNSLNGLFFIQLSHIFETSIHEYFQVYSKPKSEQKWTWEMTDKKKRGISIINKSTKKLIAKFAHHIDIVQSFLFTYLLCLAVKLKIEKKKLSILFIWNLLFLFLFAVFSHSSWFRKREKKANLVNHLL